MLLDVALLKDLDEALPGDTTGGVLWHYTSVSAAIEILRSNSIRLGCHAFMNDPAEGVAAGAMVSECWGEVIDASTEHPRLDLSYIRDTSSVLSYFDFGRPELPPTFLFSLTELQDSLGQWSRYGDNGTGISLGFRIDADALPPKRAKPWQTKTSLVRVDYDGPGSPAKMRPIIGQLLEKYLPKFRDPTPVENTLINLINRLHPLVKGSAYSEEKEWRITTRTTIDSEQLYELTCNRFGLSPYVPLTLGQGISLVELKLGPRLPAENEWSAKWLCKKYGHLAETSRSVLAYR
jgi:hypothetical protein